MILRKLVTNDCVHVSWTCFKGWREGGGTNDIAWAFFGRFLLGRSNTKKWGEHQNKKLFKNKSVKALILFKKGHLGLLKLYILLRGCSTVEENEAPKRELCLKQKNNMWGGLSRPTEILCIFWRGLGVSWSKKVRGKRRKRFCREIWRNHIWGRKGGGACENCMGQSYRNCWIHLGIFGRCLIGFCHKTADIQFLCIQLIN